MNTHRQELAKTLLGVGLTILATGCSSLHVASIPEGASVFVDGQPTGLTTPAAVRYAHLPKGRREISVQKKGYHAVTRPQHVMVKTDLVQVLVPLSYFDTRWKKVEPNALMPFYLADDAQATSVDALLEEPAVLHVYRRRVRGKIDRLVFTCRDVRGDIVVERELHLSEAISFPCDSTPVFIQATSPGKPDLRMSGLLPAVEFEAGKHYYIEARFGRNWPRVMDQERGKREFQKCHVLTAEPN